MKTKEKTQETVSAFNAKTHLSKLIQDVENGHTITITKRGKPVAKIIPYIDKDTIISRKEIIRKFEAIRLRIKGNVNIKSYINEGRKH